MRIRIPWRGERVEVELTDRRGRKRRRRVRSGRIVRLEAKGYRVRRLDRVKVHVLDAFQGPSETEWEVGRDVTRDVVERYLDADTEALYAVVLYEGAEVRDTKITNRARWQELRSAMDR
ncbi:hypothetical protein [Thiohalorhabdus methylotrophus]|uniref:ASCH domain-containing protein n=1 Tax=Thiohalorhabdus methylotrophus TaxID=3242694 RepID=A0ABV4TV49_9GAMM